MTIEYRPPGLKIAIESEYSQKRLKNRTGNSWCETCFMNLTIDGKILDAFATASEHDAQSPTHSVVISEDSCRNGLIRQG